MKIKALQRTSFIDYPDKIACTIFLFSCNFRCGFCHNPELVINEDRGDIPKHEIINFLEKRKNQLEGVCITGGEPLLTLEKDFLKIIKSLGYKIKIDTNGSFPEKLQELINENLVDYIAMDIKSSKENYQKTANSSIDIDKIEKSIKLISSLNDYEFRTTIIQRIHTPEEMMKISLWLNQVSGKKPKLYSLQGFKNKGKLLDISFKQTLDTPEDYLEQIKDQIKDYFEKIEIKV
jgi:pyruvate formate lyase activating enzyme